MASLTWRYAPVCRDGYMSYCINPDCLNPTSSLNAEQVVCRHCGSPLSLPEGKRIVRELGESGWSKTYELQDARGQSQVLKVLLLNSPKAVQLLQQEGKVLSQIHHPGIPKIASDGYFLFGLGQGREPLHCLAMEKIEGVTLEQWYRQQNSRPISQARTCDWLRQVLEVLDRLHQHLFFHCDLKPSNIILRSPDREPNREQLALVNFASIREATFTYLAFAQRSVGRVSRDEKAMSWVSPGYTPSEQIAGKGVPQSDFFALGRTFVYLLTGKCPADFPEDPRTGALIWQHRAQHISRSLVELIDYLMAPLASDRPHNVEAILQRLNAIEQSHRPMELLPQVILSGADRSKAAIRPRRLRANLLRRSRRNLKKLKRALARRKKPALLVSLSLAVGLAASQIYLENNPFFNRAIALLKTEEPPSVAAEQPPIAQTLPPNRPEILSLEHPLSGALPGVNAVAFAPDGKILASGGEDGAIALWDSQTGRLLRNIKAHQHGIKTIAFSPDGQTLASGSGDNTIKLWDVRTGKLQQTLTGHSGWVFAVAFSPDGRTLASGSGDNTIKLWGVRTGKLQQTLTGHSGWVFAVAFSPDGRTLASGSFDSKIKLWNLDRGVARRTMDSGTHRVFALAMSPDGRTLASASGDGSIKLWTLPSGRLRRTIAGHADWVRSLAIAPDSNILVSGSGDRDNTIKLWDIHSGSRLLTLTGHSDRVRSLAFRPDGAGFASGSSDNTVKLWQLP